MKGSARLWRPIVCLALVLPPLPAAVGPDGSMAPRRARAPVLGGECDASCWASSMGVRIDGVIGWPRASQGQGSVRHYSGVEAAPGQPPPR